MQNAPNVYTISISAYVYHVNITVMKKKSYHHGNLEEALLEVGLHEARATGSRNLGVTHLAKLVDVSPMAVYRHFSSGESLKAGISQHAREELARRMSAAAATETDVKLRFLAMGKAYIQFALDEPGLFSVAFTECEELPKREDSPSAWLIFQDAVRDLCNAGLIHQSDIESVTAVAWSAVHGFSMLAGGTSPFRPSTQKTAIDDLMERIWASVIQSNERSNKRSNKKGTTNR
jgi:AcrR family transcriptional regulator